MPDLVSSRRAQAAMPAGRMRPASMSLPTFAMFTSLQMLTAFRGVNRIT